MKRTFLLLLTLLLAGAACAQSPQREVNATADSATVEEDEFKLIYLIEHDPEFPGGVEALYQFLANNIKYPNTESECYGKVYVTFVVEEDGSITDPKVIRDPCPGLGLGEEAMRLVKLMPKWKPGLQSGKPVRVQFYLPINFNLK